MRDRRWVMLAVIFVTRRRQRALDGDGWNADELAGGLCAGRRVWFAGLLMAVTMVARMIFRRVAGPPDPSAGGRAASER